jgi:hypothetical protein
MDLIIILILIIAICFFFKDFRNVVYFFGILEIFFRVIHYIANHIGVSEIANVVNTYIPSSLLSVIAKYANGLLYDIFAWGLVFIFCCLEFYLIKYFIKRK